MEYKNTPTEEIMKIEIQGLNPCFNGIQKYWNAPSGGLPCVSLNPCFNGIQKYNSEYKDTQEVMQS